MATSSTVLLFTAIVFVYGQQKGRYNILFLQSDEMDGRLLDPYSPYWNIVSMPNLRDLAKEGINFINSYTNSPVCVTSRSSMWTGRYVNDIQTWSNEKSLCAQVENPNKADPYCANITGYGEQYCVEMGKRQNVTTTIKQSMISADYDVQLFGKMDIGGGMSITNTTNANGFHSSQNANWSSQINGSCSINTTQSYCPGEVIHFWARHSNVSYPDMLPPTEGKWININSTQGSSMEVHDEKVMNECVDYIDTYAKSDQTKPFLMYCSMVNPHPPYWSNSTWLKYLNYTALNSSYSDLLNNFNNINSFDSMNDADKFLSISYGIGNMNYTDDSVLPNWSYNLYQAYFASCATLDYMMGQIINKLKKYPDLYDNTLIIYTSDHGEMHLEHRAVEKTSMYEASSRVPLIVSGPNIASNVRIRNNFTSLVDIFPTLLDAANISYHNKIYPKNLNGYSLSPFFNWKWINNDKNNPYLQRPDYVFSEYHGSSTNIATYMLRQNKYKLILYATNWIYANYTPQLFDLNNDRNELENIANENQEIVNNMTNTINNILMKTAGGDYNYVDNIVNNEGKQSFLRWQTAIDNGAKNNNIWINYTNATYVMYNGATFNENDVHKMNTWLNATYINM